MKITLDINKSVEENAGQYFEQAKKARKKIQGVKRTLDTFNKKEEKETKTQQEINQEDQLITKIVQTKKYWFEKFKWFITSEGFLVVAGRDATTNEILIKKHLDDQDLVFHTDMAGSPFIIIKHNKEDVKKILSTSFSQTSIGQESIDQAGSFTFLHSKAWKIGIAQEQVFYVKPHQITKTAQSGEYLTKGAFMIRGEKTFLQPQIDICVGVSTQTPSNKPQLFLGPQIALKTYCEELIDIQQGNQKPKEIAQIIQKTFQKTHQVLFSLNDITHILPTGSQIPKRRLRKDELKK